MGTFYSNQCDESNHHYCSGKAFDSENEQKCECLCHRMGELAGSVLAAMYASEINFSITTFWDAGFDWYLGDEMNGFVDEGQQSSLAAAITELCDAAIELYPDSDFAKKFDSIISAK